MKVRGKVVFWCIVVLVIGSCLATLEKEGDEAVSQTKYANQVAMPAPTALRGMSRGLQAQIQKLFQSGGRAIWVTRGPSADQSIAASTTVILNDVEIKDRFPQCVVSVSFRMEYTISSMPGWVIFTGKLLLDGKTALGDHEAQTFNSSSENAVREEIILEDVIPLTAGMHTIQVQFVGSTGFEDATIHADSAVLIVKQL